MNAPDNIKSVPLKAMLGAYPHLFHVRNNQVTLLMDGGVGQITRHVSDVSIDDTAYSGEDSSARYNDLLSFNAVSFEPMQPSPFEYSSNVFSSPPQDPVGFRQDSLFNDFSWESNDHNDKLPSDLLR